MKKRFYFRWRGTLTRDVGTTHVDAATEELARALFKSQHPYRVIVAMYASVDMPTVTSKPGDQL